MLTGSNLGIDRGESDPKKEIKFLGVQMWVRDGMNVDAPMGGSYRLVRLTGVSVKCRGYMQGGEGGSRAALQFVQCLRRDLARLVRHGG